jgi:hypothetical protein
MKYSTHNLNDPKMSLPLAFPIKVIVEYRPNGVPVDSAPVVYSVDPEAIADEVVEARGWRRQPGYGPKDVWVDGGV